MTEEWEIAEARGCLAAFSPQHPMVVGQSIYREMVNSGHFADMLDRVIVNQPIPVRRQR